MVSEREVFNLSGPLHLTCVDWNNVHHRRSVAACLVQGVYILERDRQEKREGPQALAPPWWEFFNFQLLRKLVDNVDSSIFGAIFEYKPPSSSGNHSADGPHFVVAFRGTMTKKESVSRDIRLDLHFIQHGLHSTSRFETAMQAVRNMVATAGESRVWLAGHSLGSALALLAGKNMAKTGFFLESFLFNPPYVSAPVEKIKNTKVKLGIRFTTSVITAGLTLAMKAPHLRNQSADSFAALSAWVPQLYVNAADHVCSEYIGYFEHRNRMKEIGAGAIEKLATQHSIGSLFMSAMGKQAEPLHLIPSANLSINLNPSSEFKRAHGIHQWWGHDLNLQSKVYTYS